MCSKYKKTPTHINTHTPNKWSCTCAGVSVTGYLFQVVQSVTAVAGTVVGPNQIGAVGVWPADRRKLHTFNNILVHRQIRCFIKHKERPHVFLCGGFSRPCLPIQMLLSCRGSSPRSVGAQPPLHAHMKDPGMLVHMDSGPQTVEFMHSSMSEKGKDQK